MICMPLDMCNTNSIVFGIPNIRVSISEHDIKYGAKQKMAANVGTITEQLKYIILNNILVLLMSEIIWLRFVRPILTGVMKPDII